MTINETQALKWAAISIAVATGIASGATWTLLYEMRKRIRRNRALRKQREEEKSPAHVDQGQMAGVR